MKIFYIRLFDVEYKFVYRTKVKGQHVFYHGAMYNTIDAEDWYEGVMYTFRFQRSIDSWKNMSGVKIQNTDDFSGDENIKTPYTLNKINPKIYAELFVEGIKGREHLDEIASEKLEAADIYHKIPANQFM